MSKLELNNFELPFIIQKDSEYYTKLETVLKQYLSEIQQYVAPDTYQLAARNTQFILEAINYYYDANLTYAKKNILKILVYCSHDPFIVARLDD